MTSISFQQRPSTLAGTPSRLLAALFDTSGSPLLSLLRLTLGLVMLPHGLQKTLGWFGGYGFDATMGWFSSIGIPPVLAFLAIAAESAGAVALVAGFGTRVAALGVGTVMAVAASIHKANGFFMNWSGAQGGEGVEYHLLAIGIALVLVIAGGGAFSADRAITSRLRQN